MKPVPDASAPRVPAPPRALLAPDAFKGTAEAPAIALAMAAGAQRAGWGGDRCPLSDGGEGFAAVLAAVPTPTGTSVPGAWHETTVTGPLGEPVVARWWMADHVAVVESAAASGLPLAGGAEGNDPLAATTRGTGELVVAAVGAGARRVLMGVGGSATTDGGAGALAAIEEGGGLGGVELVVACDVKTLFIEAAEQFGPQKGATPAQVVELRDRLAAQALGLRERYGVAVEDVPGSGAAGGLAGGLAALGAQLVPGFGVVADAVGLAARLALVDLVVTGEGRLDASSWSGKVVGGVVALAREAGIPVLIVAGAVGPGGPEGAGEAEIHSLTARFGDGRARSDPARGVEEVVAQALARR